MCQHHALGLASGAGRVDDSCQRVALNSGSSLLKQRAYDCRIRVDVLAARRGDIRDRRHSFGPRPTVGIHHGCGSEAGKLSERGRDFVDLRAIRDDGDFRAAVTEDALNLWRRERRIHRHRHTARGHHRQVRDAPFRATLSNHSHTIPYVKTELGQPEADVADLLEQLAAGYIDDASGAAAAQDSAVRKAFRDLEWKVGERLDAVMHHRRPAICSSMASADSSAPHAGFSGSCRWGGRAAWPVLTASLEGLVAVRSPRDAGDSGGSERH